MECAFVGKIAHSVAAAPECSTPTVCFQKYIAPGANRFLANKIRLWTFLLHVFTNTYGRNTEVWLLERMERVVISVNFDSFRTLKTLAWLSNESESYLWYNDAQFAVQWRVLSNRPVLSTICLAFSSLNDNTRKCMLERTIPKSKKKLLYDWQSVSQSVNMSWYRVPLSKSKLLYDWQSFSQYVLVSSIEYQILFPVRMLLSEICGLVSIGRPLWRDDTLNNT
jgi:hypothetical protein